LSKLSLNWRIINVFLLHLVRNQAMLPSYINNHIHIFIYIHTLPKNYACKPSAQTFDCGKKILVVIILSKIYFMLYNTLNVNNSSNFFRPCTLKRYKRVYYVYANVRNRQKKAWQGLPLSSLMHRSLLHFFIPLQRVL